MKEARAVPVQGGPPVTFCPLQGVTLGLPGFGISGAGPLRKCLNECPGWWVGLGRGEDLVLSVDPSFHENGNL